MPLDRLRYSRFAALVLLLAAFVLLLVATLSVPIIRSLAFVRASETTSALGLIDTSASLSLGVFGACWSTGKSGQTCSAPALGFRNGALGPLRVGSAAHGLSLSGAVDTAGISGTSKLLDAISGGVTFLFVLHPIGASVTLLRKHQR
jgi:hypothetical protein